MINDKLIYDIGMHTGEDTVHYLKKGFNVVAVEANPVLAEQNSKKFAKAIEEKRLTILNVGIAPQEGELIFYKNLRLTEWSSFDKVLGSRGGGYEELQVQCVTTEKLFETYGIPFYLKVDIEGFDYLCINALGYKNELPKYVSCEASELSLLDTLYAKGYRKFKFIGQSNDFAPPNIAAESNKLYERYLIVKSGIKMRIQKYIPFRHLYGSSGPFAEETKGDWMTHEEVAKLFNAFYFPQGKLAPINKANWFDFHAKQ
ncbi:MAG TPA: FkbM family methyltransferase [Chitinophagaceae bacterium]